MANRFTIRFYTVEKLNPAEGFTFKQSLEAIAAIPSHANRERQLTVGMTIRLERFEVDANEFTGEFTRVIQTGFPYDVRPNGVAPLNNGNRPLGDGIAFRFRPADHTLAIQYDTKIASPGRIVDYLMQMDGRGAFKITPKVDPENWRKFQDSPVRKLKVGIASPQHLEEIEDEGAPVYRAFQDLGEAYAAPEILIQMGMGHRKGALNEAVKGLAAQIFGMFTEGDADLRSLRGTVKIDGHERSEEINLIDEVISNKYEVDLPRNDPDRSYEVRRDFLKRKLREHGNRQREHAAR
jgi:hypothetical protein